MKYLYILIIACVFSLSTKAQEGLFNDEDSAAFNILSVYPQNIRTHILECSSHPELLLKTEELQKRTSKSYKTILWDFTKKEQENFWELSRYEGLIEKMVVGGQKKKEELELIAAAYPESLRSTIVSYGERFRFDLEEIYKLNKKSDLEFNNLIKNYPATTQNSMRELVKHPELIGTLNNNMRVTVWIGDMYKNRKEYIEKKMDSVSLAQAELKSKELEAWKAGLESNPEAKKEMIDAAKEFSKEQGSKDEDFAVSGDVNVNVIVNPYPYWFGYPYWYNYPYWYPRPYWYDWGFYYGPAGFVYIGMPSPFFTNWYFWGHHHHYYYSHFSDYCIGHYYGHRNSHLGFNKEVNNWARKTEAQLPRGYFNNDPKRVERIKELGKFEIDYRNNNKVPGKKVSRADYQKNNGNNYPNLNTGRPTQTKPVPKSQPTPKVNIPRQKTPSGSPGGGRPPAKKSGGRK